jgi:hypothetical protein
VNPALLDAVRFAVCGIGYLTVPLEEFQQDQMRRGLEIIGTGFLFGPGQVVTCLHVLTDLRDEMRKRRIPAAQRFAQFGRPGSDGSWEGGLWTFTETDSSEEVDLAYVSLDDFGKVPWSVPPVRVISNDRPRPQVGDEVAMCGYGHGSGLLRNAGSQLLERMGPITQHGWIAALGPYDGPGPRALWLDIVAAPTASGSPVFLTETGEVVGVLVEGQEGKNPIVSVATPIVDAGASIAAPRARLMPFS